MKWLTFLLLLPLFTFAQATRVDSSATRTTTYAPGSGGIEAMLAYPDPDARTTTFRVRNALQNATLTVIDPLGQIMRRMPKLWGREFTLQHAGLPSGLYQVVLNDGKKSWAQRILIE